jgi:hypothetical protein
METHVKVFGVLCLVLSALMIVGAVTLLLTFTTAATIVGTTASPDDAAIALPIIGIAGSALAFFLFLLAVPGLVTGWGLLTLKPWARILGIVLSILNLINIPFGTILGIYGLWVLLSSETERLFAAPRTPAT